MSYKAFVENSVTSGLKAFKKTAQNLDIVLVCADCLNAELTNLIKEMHWLNPVISIVLSVAEINSEQKEQLEQLGVSAFTSGACDLIELERAILRAKHSNKPL